MSTDVATFIQELDGSVFERKLAQALSEAAASVSNFGEKGRKGKVQITFDLERFGSSGAQVLVTHKLSSAVLTENGKFSEEDTTQTPMYVGRRGALSFFPEDQTQMFDHKGGVSSEQNSNEQ